VFDFGKPEVRDLLIQNAKFFLDEYRVDGFRYDQVSVIDHDGAPDGWSFCQDLTATLRHHRPSALEKAEYWSVNPYVVKAPPEGAGFVTTLTDGLRIAVRDVIGNASHPNERPLDMTGLARSLWPEGFAEHWRFVQGPENHDVVYRGREQRIARLGHPDNPRSWFGRSRARVATGISLTAPGIPMLFMGQEFLEDKQWSDDFEFHKALLLHWAGLDSGDRQAAERCKPVMTEHPGIPEGNTGNDGQEREKGLDTESDEAQMSALRVDSQVPEDETRGTEHDATGRQHVGNEKRHARKGRKEGIVQRRRVVWKVGQLERRTHNREEGPHDTGEQHMR
jgi:1,4-alpha-glucan branching enzyme